jgi:hypothetical protein
MGYATVLHLDHRHVRAAALDGAAIGDALVDVVDGARHHETPAAVGPWLTCGSFHASSMVVISATASTLEVGRGVDDGDWCSQVTATRHAAAARTVQQHPGRFTRAVASGTGLAELMFGRDRGATADASVWWFYDDAAGDIDAAALGAGVLGLLDTHFDSAVSTGVYANALNKAGFVHGDGSVLLVWSGNRLCRPDELSERERAVYGRRFDAP